MIKYKLCTRNSYFILKSYGPKLLNKFSNIVPFCNHKFLSTYLKIYKNKSNDKIKIRRFREPRESFSVTEAGQGLYHALNNYPLVNE